MKIMRSVWMAARVAVALFVCAGVAAAQEELKIGAIGSLSGGGTAWGLALQRGVTLAIDDVAKRGGLKIGDKTYMPKLIMYDDQYTATGGKTAAERLVNLDKVKYIIGPFGSPAVLSSLVVTTPNKVLQLSNGYAPAILKNDAGSPYNFRVMNSNTEFGPAMIKWLHAKYPNIKKVALVAPNDAVGQAVLPTLVEAYKANGIEVWTDMYERGTKEFGPLLTRMIAQNVDLFDLNSNAPGEAGLLLKQARQAGFDKMIWQVGGPSVEEIIAVAGPLAEG
ncbi:MAG: ABC transporter substrate-binding protein, partial [Bradyrhizobiaceae bacterium]|nr:ABC transporter substrate-binding protein [Bradyrhizobiaceae bacterium]